MKYLFIADVKNVGFFILSYLQKHMSIDDTDEVFKGRYWDRFYHHDNKSVISGYRIKYKSEEIIFNSINPFLCSVNPTGTMDSDLSFG